MLWKKILYINPQRYRDQHWPHLRLCFHILWYLNSLELNRPCNLKDLNSNSRSGFFFFLFACIFWQIKTYLRNQACSHLISIKGDTQDRGLQFAWNVGSIRTALHCSADAMWDFGWGPNHPLYLLHKDSYRCWVKAAGRWYLITIFWPKFATACERLWLLHSAGERVFNPPCRRD